MGRDVYGLGNFGFEGFRWERQTLSQLRLKPNAILKGYQN